MTNFKSNLEKFKTESFNTCRYKFWDISQIIIDKIEGNPNYQSNKDIFKDYLFENPYVARKKGIKIN